MSNANAPSSIGTSLAKKLAIRPGNKVLLVGAPAGIDDELADLPEGARVSRTARGLHDVVVLFVQNARELARTAKKAMDATTEEGILWIAYPKKSSGVTTDLSRDHGWEAVEGVGWTVVSLVAVDETWSALRWKRGGEGPRSMRASRPPVEGVDPVTRTVTPPPDLQRALGKDAAVKATWGKLSFTHKREFVEWIQDAKQDDTRARRIEQTLAMLREGRYR